MLTISSLSSHISRSVPESFDSVNRNRSRNISRSLSRIILDSEEGGEDGAHPEGDGRPYIRTYIHTYTRTYTHNTYLSSVTCLPDERDRRGEAGNRKQADEVVTFNRGNVDIYRALPWKKSK